ncbi:MAG: CHASE2 domain-containing protein [Caldithrix sp.]|nr:CHASE2 domain-containing protein [Caldithrix sp.]
MKLSQPKARIWVYGVIVLASILLAYVLGVTTVFQTLELKLLDMRYSYRGPMPVKEAPIVILAIDDQSEQSTPHRWPWPRSYYAHIVENLQEAGAAVIGIDVILDKSDKYGTKHDSLFREILQRNSNVVLTGKLLRSMGQYEYNTLITPYEGFMTDSSSWGLAAIEADIDGFYRRYLFAQSHHDSLYPSLAAEVIREYLGIPKDQPLKQDEQYFYLGSVKVRKYHYFDFLINFAGPARSFTYYPFDNVLDDQDFELADDFDLNMFDDPDYGLKQDEVFKDKIVLIGSTIQELHDNFPTPFLEYETSSGNKAKAEMPGVEIHANAIYTILSEMYLKEMAPIGTFLIVVLLTLIAFVITRKLRAGGGVVLLIFMVIGYVFLTFWMFDQFNYILQVTTPVLAVVFSFAGNTIYQYVLAQKEKQVIRGAFAHYVPEKVVEQIISNPESLTLGGEERNVSVLFSDIAGFTTISEGMRPRDLVALLNEYLTNMTNVILEYNGIIDKFEGDAIMAEFGMPVPVEDHAFKACSAALAMQKDLRKLRTNWLKEGKPEIRARIGINTGEVIVGNMGSQDVFDYTVMGDQVNLGARLEGANKFYDTNIMISEFTYVMIKDQFITRPLDLLRVKGKNKPITVYELIGHKETDFTEDFREFLDIYNRAMELYRQRLWPDALKLFARCIELNKEDKPSRIYHRRSLEYSKTPPPKEWDGVTTLDEK